MTQSKRVYVFSSNEAGSHTSGTALVAYKKHGARYGCSYGHYGDSFAIPTKNQNLETLELDWIEDYVIGFLAYAHGHPELTFQVTRIGCGLAGHKDEDIAEMFRDAPRNCLFDDAWHPFLGNFHNYWGTV